MTAHETQLFDASVPAYDGVEPDGALNAALERGRRIHRIDLMEKS
jgi:hypothetical protein